MAFQVIEQRPVLVRERLGSIPRDGLGKSVPFSPSTAPPYERLPGDRVEVRDGQDVFGEVPQFHPDGSLKVDTRTLDLEVAPYSPAGRAVVCGLLSAAAGAALGAATAGVPGAVLAGLTALTGGSLVGYLSARGDAIRIVDRQQAVTMPVLTGFRHAQMDQAFLPERPGHWWNNRGGTYHYYVPEIVDRPAGQVTVQEVRHRSMRPAPALALSTGLGAVLGLAAPALLALL
ncbi:MAG: hypothetical protein AB1758_31860 [Candidatus Eremiobacterota bacterium]